MIALLAVGASVDSTAAERPFRVLTTFLPGYCLTKQVGGEQIEVQNLLPPNASLHDFSLSPRDLKRLREADLVVLNGLGLEDWLEKPLRSAGVTSEKTLVLSRGLEKELIEGAGPHHDHDATDHTHSTQFNPHVWLDPGLARRMVTNLLEGLKERVPAFAVDFERNAARVIESLDRIDRDYRDATSMLKGVPFMTYHNAFAYLARRYELNLVGVVEAVPEIAPSGRELRRLHELIREKKVRVLFTEPGGGNRLARQIVRDANMTLAELDPIEAGPLRADAYEQALRGNLEALTKALHERKP